MCNFFMLCKTETDFEMEFAKRNNKNLKVNRQQKRALVFLAVGWNMTFAFIHIWKFSSLYFYGKYVKYSKKNASGTFSKFRYC